MSLQTTCSEMPAHSARESNIINSPSSELLRMCDDMRVALEANPERALKIALGFLKRLASSEKVEATRARGGLAPWQKRKVDRYLRENFERSIGLNELAGEAKLSLSHFCRAFKKSFGETPHACVLRLRLELAQKLMLTTNDPLSQIARSEERV